LHRFGVIRGCGLGVSAELFAVHFVFEEMQLAGRRDGARGEPDVRSGNALHGWTRFAIDFETRASPGSTDGPDEIRALPHPRRAITERVLVKRIDESVFEF